MPRDGNRTTEFDDCAACATQQNTAPLTGVTIASGDERADPRVYSFFVLIDTLA